MADDGSSGGGWGEAMGAVASATIFPAEDTSLAVVAIADIDDVEWD